MAKLNGLFVCVWQNTYNIKIAIFTIFKCTIHGHYLYSQCYATIVTISFFSISLFIYLWLRWVFVAARGLSLVAAREGYSSLRCSGIYIVAVRGLLIAVASLVVEHRL